VRSKRQQRRGGRRARRPRHEASRPLLRRCRECGKVTSDLYWWLFERSFKKQKYPLCSTCYEEWTRRNIREALNGEVVQDKLKEDGELW
jgi:hypothetical protein